MEGKRGERGRGKRGGRGVKEEGKGAVSLHSVLHDATNLPNRQGSKSHALWSSRQVLLCTEGCLDE